MVCSCKGSGIMNLTVLIAVAIGAVLLSLVLGERTIKRNVEKISKTKILTTAPHYTGRLNGSFYTETTFMLYYHDGTHKAVTDKNGTSEYNHYMSKLEG